MSVLALDIATATGWAYGPPGTLERTGTINLQATGHGYYAMEFFRAVHVVIKDTGATAVAYEMPIITPTTGLQVARKLYSLATIAEMVCVQVGGIEFHQVRMGPARKHFCGSAGGKRDEIKARVLAECHRRGYDPKDQDQADAICIWQFATEKL